ncbi:MAG: GLUG motif-containing protein [Rikenellaceae bacterium]
MKRFFAVATIVAIVVCALVSCKKDEVIIDRGTFTYSAATPTLTSTGASVAGGSYTFMVSAEFDWKIVVAEEDEQDDEQATETEQSKLITIEYDGYTVTRNYDGITVDIDALGALQYREIAIEFSSEDGEIRSTWTTYQYGTGEGTAAIPFFLSTAVQIINIAKTVNDGNTQKGVYYQMICSIDLNGGPTNKWTTIGKSGLPFKGHFNGGGHEITGLYIDDEDVGYQGLFGYLADNGTIEKLGVRGYIKVKSSVTGSSSSMSDGSESNYNIGGIVGYNNDGNISYCYNHCEVLCYGVTVGNFGENVGGIVGYNYGGEIKNCYNTGAITGINNFVGGITGWNKGEVDNCYNVGYITATSVLVGGIAGGTNGSSQVNNCYSLTGSVVSGSNNDIEIAPDGTIAGIDGTVMSEGEMRSTWFVAKLGDSAWMADYATPVNGGYPIFTWQ